MALFAGPASAETFTYTPDPEDLGDLNHSKYFTWGIDVSELAGRQIIEVTLVLEYITNHNSGQNVLYMHLMDDATLGVSSFGDNQSDFVDELAGEGPLIDAWVDNNGSSIRDTLEYDMSTLGLLDSARVFAEDDVLAVGFDPDCHYYNRCVKLIIEADPLNAAEPTSWGLLKRRFNRE
jgi:hypothetical protein